MGEARMAEGGSPLSAHLLSASNPPPPGTHPSNLYPTSQFPQTLPASLYRYTSPRPTTQLMMKFLAFNRSIGHDYPLP